MNDNIEVSLVEQVVMNESFLHELKGWRCYRIEYGGCENSNPEGCIYLPPDINPYIAEQVINAIVEGKQIFFLNNYRENNGTSRSL